MGSETTMKFKVGEEVKISSKFPVSADIGRICVVTVINPAGKLFDYDVKDKSSYWSCPVHEYELERIFIKGKQLEFAFMGEVI